MGGPLLKLLCSHPTIEGVRVGNWETVHVQVVETPEILELGDVFLYCCMIFGLDLPITSLRIKWTKNGIILSYLTKNSIVV